MAFVPRIEMRKQVVRDIRSIFDASSREDAERLLRLVSAIVAQISEEWEAGRGYLDMEAD